MIVVRRTSVFLALVDLRRATQTTRVPLLKLIQSLIQERKTKLSHTKSMGAILTKVILRQERFFENELS